ncbi:pyrroline-5-carboxylate reductase [Planctomycetales bacterium]|nr:pyrroline-5-carboxylate reductase [Planctomycetales bacterium]GHS98413.1 pyrroline-5-carboxylate reductase [Planctomycetales bacterium]GHT05933.1 pyrroline-5-carboxylate reductase [Planctomycetales bacterium]
MHFAFIGAGNMAEAIARAVVKNELSAPAEIIVCDPAAERRQIFAALGIQTATDNLSALSAPVIVLAVKPQQMDAALTALASDNRVAEKLFISIMAGVSTATLEKRLAGRVMRVMPNLPIVGGAGMSAVARGARATAADEELTLKIFRAGGEAIALAEKHFDAVTAVSGSGPAYVFWLTEMMQTAAQKLGLPDDAAALLARQTVVGAAKIISTTDLPPSVWRERVTSQGGTTAAALNYLAANQTGDAVVAAIAAAAMRSAELGKSN